MALIQDAMSASIPGTANQFLGSTQPKPMMQMIMYLGMLSILPILGYLIAGLIGGSIVFGLVYGILISIGLIAAAIGTGFIISALSAGSLGRQATADECITMVGYAMTPVFVFGFIGAIIGGLIGFGWGGFGLDVMFISLGMLYATFLVYLGSGVRFGQDKAIVPALVFFIAGGIIFWVFAMIAWQIAWRMLVRSVIPYNPYVNYNPYVGYP